MLFSIFSVKGLIYTRQGRIKSILEMKMTTYLRYSNQFQIKFDRDAITFQYRMWDLIVSVPDHCLSFYFAYQSSCGCAVWWPVALKSLPVHSFNALIIPVLRDCLQSFFNVGTNCAPLVADLFLFCYERDFMSLFLTLSKLKLLKHLNLHLDLWTTF